MKKTKIILIAGIILLGMAIESKAQFSDNQETFVYGELGGGFGDFSAARGALNVIYGKSSIITIGGNHFSRIAPGQPSDFRSVMGRNLYQTFNSTDLMYGKLINCNNPKVRFILRGGISVGTFSNPTNFAYQPGTSGSFNGNLIGPLTYALGPIGLLAGILASTGGTSASYSYTTDKQSTAGLVFHPTIEFPLSGGFGFSAGAYGNINSNQNIFGVDANIIFGKIRSRNTNWWSR